MLRNLDKALAGAIDVVADDVTATLKSVREQGMARTLGDAVEDAGSLVFKGAGDIVGGFMGRKGGEKDISNHSGVNSSYADLCAGRGMNGNFQGGGMSIPAYQPQAGPGPKAGPGGRPGAAPKQGGFGPGIGISRPGGGPSPGAFHPAANPGFNPMPGMGAPPGPSPGAFHPAAKYGGQPQQQFPAYGGQQAYPGSPQVPAYQGPGPAARGGYGGGAPPQSFQAPPPPTGGARGAGYSSSASTGGNFASPTASKEEQMDPNLLAQRFEEVRRKCPSMLKCFDCEGPNPEWASVSLGILVCMTCSGHHRHMGTHISRVRSCKMDTWTERQWSIFSHGGNKRLADFFAANNAPRETRYQRYHTPAAEWYREAFIKNKVFGKPVPKPDQGVVAGPCAIDGAPEVKKAAAPAADLLDFDAEPSKPAAKAAAPAAAADLLGFDDAPSAPSAPKDSDLVGGGDLLGMGGGSAPSASAPFDILGLASTAANARPNSSALSGLDFNAAPAPAAAPAAPTAFTTTVPAQTTAPAYTAPAQDAGPMAGTLAGGAKYVEKKEEKEKDPFAMALDKWGM